MENLRREKSENLVSGTMPLQEMLHERSATLLKRMRKLLIVLEWPLGGAANG